MVRSCNSCSKTNRSFSCITGLVFYGMRLFYTQLPKFCSVRDAPGPFCQGCARSVPTSWDTPTPGVFVRADSKGLAGEVCARVSKQAVSKHVESRRCEAFVRAESKGLSATECAPLASARGASAG